MRKVVIYCSSRGDLPVEVIEGARLIASCIGECGAELIYGGVNAGLMHIVAQAAHDSGAKVTGIVPEVFRERADAVCDEVILTRDLNERKGLMIGSGDIFIVLPGGIGTIDEWISTLSDIMVRERVDLTANRPILVWSHEGMYRGLEEQLNATAESVYARGKRVNRSFIFNHYVDLADALRNLIG